MLRWALAAAACIVVLVVAAVAVRQLAVGPDGYALYRPVLASEIKGRTEAHLYYPNSVVLYSNSADMTLPFWFQSGSAAYVAATLGTDATEAEVLSWYRSELAASGWREDGEGTGAANWERGQRELYGVTIFVPGSGAYTATTMRTEYRVAYGVGFSH